MLFVECSLYDSASPNVWKVFMCCSLLNGYIIKIECRVINPICSASREECFSFVGIKIYQPQLCPVAYFVKVNIKDLSSRVREVNYDVKSSIVGKQADI